MNDPIYNNLQYFVKPRLDSLIKFDGKILKAFDATETGFNKSSVPSSKELGVVVEYIISLAGCDLKVKNQTTNRQFTESN